MKHKIICGKSEIELKQFEDNSFDSCVTDPPYNLTSITRPRPDQTKNGDYGKEVPFSRVQSRMSGGFMGKEWDGTGISFKVELWQEVYRVLKPGAHILVFGGTRTYHRMACAVEDAGFEIRDMINWVYGCLSEDTEILTINGWEHYHKNIYKDRIPILIYDIQKNIFKWEQPERWQEYNINKDTCYRIQSNNTGQLISRNHRCLIEREGKLIFEEAENLSELENMLTLSNDFLELHKGQPKVLLPKMQWLLQGAGMEEVGGSGFSEIKSSREQNKERKQRRKESRLEGGRNLFQEERKLRKIQNKICSLSSIVYSYGEEGWLCNGAPIINGKEVRKMFKEDRSSTPQRPQPREQQNREFDIIQDKQGTQNLRGIRIEKAKVTKEVYSGLVFCPTVSTGCFVTRRNGKIFITGNSDFPKSLNISKQLDKMAGVEPEVISENPNARDTCGNINICKKNGRGTITAPTSEQAIQWDGWGTGLKPAHEPILLARKPISERNIVSNVLKWGVGGINVDGCRINHNENLKEQVRGEPLLEWKSAPAGKIFIPNQQGRFPANLILECCCEEGKIMEEKIKSAGWRDSDGGDSSLFGTGIENYHGSIHYADKEGNEKCLHTNPNCVCKMLDEQSGFLHPSANKELTKRGKTDNGIFGNGNITRPHRINGVVDYKGGGASRFFKIIKVDQDNSFIYDVDILINEVEKCGNILENQKGDGMLNGVRKEVERYIQNVEQFLCGKKSMENFQRDTKSIISTLIKLMIELKTYNVCREETINYCMGESEKAIKLLMGLNTEDAKDVKNIRFLLNFKNVLRELIRDIASNVKGRNYKNGEIRTENTTMNICKNITENIEQNKSFFYQAKASQKERWFYCMICKQAYPMKERDKHIHNVPEKEKYKYLEFHPTQKPLQLIQYLIRLITPPNGITLDPFSGSGTTLIAAEREGFNAIGIDSKLEYCLISYQRLKNEIEQPQTELTKKQSTIEKIGF